AFVSDGRLLDQAELARRGDRRRVDAAVRRQDNVGVGELVGERPIEAPDADRGARGEAGAGGVHDGWPAGAAEDDVHGSVRSKNATARAATSRWIAPRSTSAGSTHRSPRRLRPTSVQSARNV